MTPIFVGDPTQMETVLTELLKASPVGAAILTTMLLFLKAMGKRDEAFEKTQERWHANWIDSKRESNEAIIRTATSVAEIKEAIHVNTDMVSSVKDGIERVGRILEKTS